MADGMDLGPALVLVDAALDGRMPGGAAGPGKPRLLVRPADPDVTVAELRTHLAAAGRLYDRGMPVRLAHDAMAGGAVAHPMTPDGMIREAHLCCRPFMQRERREGVVEVDAALPKGVALMYLDMRGEWGLQPLNGIASAPLLDNAGGIHAHQGYDPGTGMWCEHVPPGLDAAVPQNPTRDQAAEALLVLRRLLRTFAFADAPTTREDGQDVPVVDLSQPPAMDESTALVALLTAVCRPSLPLAPGLLVRAAPLSGAGSGKGLLVRVLCAVAFGRAPAAVTAGGTPEELDKRIGAELMAGGPVVFLDNLNDTALRSDALASAITERPARVRVLGKSVMVPLNASAFITLTGNGLTVREDLARRFLSVELDAGVEDPETRRFRGDVLADALANRAALLAAALTLWRWGRHQDAAGTLTSGVPLGSFGIWCRWVRDPLVMLGCADPAKRVADAKAHDRNRQNVAELFGTWHREHGGKPMEAAKLARPVLRLLDPQGRGRQYVAAALGRLAGTRAGGFVLTAQPPVGAWGATTYAVRPTAAPAPDGTGPHGAGLEIHRGHRDHGNATPSDAPYGPYGSALAVPDGDAAPGWSGKT